MRGLHRGGHGSPAVPGLRADGYRRRGRGNRRLIRRPASGSLHAVRRNRARRDGSGLSGATGGLEPDRGGQGAARSRLRRRWVPRPVPARGGNRRMPQSPGNCNHPRNWRGARAAVSGDGFHRWAVAGGSLGGIADDAGIWSAFSPRGSPRGGARPPAGSRSPRFKTLQHFVSQRHPACAHGLRTGAVSRSPGQPRRVARCDGIAALFAARAAGGRGGCRPGGAGYLRLGCGAVPLSNRSSAVCRGFAQWLAGGGEQRGSHRAAAARPIGAGGLGNDLPEMPGDLPGGALRHRGGSGGRTRSFPARRTDHRPPAQSRRAPLPGDPAQASGGGVDPRVGGGGGGWHHSFAGGMAAGDAQFL